MPSKVRMLRVKSDKSDWFWSQSIVFTQPLKTGMSLGLARGPDISSAWQNWPLGTRLKFVSLPLGVCWNVWNVIEIECQPGTFPVHVAFKCHFCGLSPPQASCDLFFLDFKRGAGVLFVLHLKSVKSEIVVRPTCSSLISDLSFVPPWSRFLH